MGSLKRSVFFPAFLGVLAVSAVNLVMPQAFAAATESLYKWVLEAFGWLFSAGAFVMVATVLVVALSRFGKTTIGGPNASRIMSPMRMFMIALCTGIAVGIVLFATAEPLNHFRQPPESTGIEARSPQSQVFAMSTMYSHWTVTPYAMYCVAGLAFALGHYNHRGPFSLLSTLMPWVGRFPRLWQQRIGTSVDTVYLFSIIAGIAASLGSGLMLLSGGFHSIWGIEPSRFVAACIALVLVITVSMSAVTGILRGIRILSMVNFLSFVAFALFICIVGPTASIAKQGLLGTSDFVQHYFGRILPFTEFSEDPWGRDWTIFYWGNWFAWTPMIGVFLGKIARGYTLRQFVAINLLLPALFGGLWMTIFSGTSLHLQASGAVDLLAALEAQGPEAVMYKILRQYPLAGFTIPLFMMTVFLSLVTATDSTVTVMSGLCSEPDESQPGALEPLMWPKIAWAICAGLVAWSLTQWVGLQGVRMISNLGGIPGVILCLLMAGGLLLQVWKSRVPRQLS